jgi:predicted O-methyltransferase YrrM
VIIIYYGDFLIYGTNFLFDNAMTKEEFKKKVYSPFCIEPKIKYDELIHFLKKEAKERIYSDNLVLKKKYDEFFYLSIMDIIKRAKKFKIPQEKMIKLQQNMIKIFYETFIEKKMYHIHSKILGEEGMSIQQILKKYNCKKCIEVGMAFGISAYSILSYSPDITLISIDSKQITKWDKSGLKLLKKMNVDKNHKWMKKKSYIGLSELLKKNGQSTFDFIYINDWNTFEYMIVNIFYASLLLKVGGILLINDILLNSVGKCIKYIDTNCDFLKRIPTTETQTGYLKIKDDDREWSFHRPF